MIFFQNFKSESDLIRLGIRALPYLKLKPVQICILQKSIDLEKGTFLDFLIKIQGDHALKKIYEAFEIWLKDSSNVKKTIKCFRCYGELMFHELNSIYKPWYKRKAPKLSPECKRVLKTFKKRKKRKS